MTEIGSAPIVPFVSFYDEVYEQVRRIPEGRVCTYGAVAALAGCQPAGELEPAPGVVRQHEQLGTAHAVAQARPALAGAEGDALVLYGDTPFIRRETLRRMATARAGELEDRLESLRARR